jgi:hypothetical protein
MAHLRWTLALLVALAGTAALRAQGFLFANPYDPVGFTVGRGFTYHRHRVTVSGFTATTYSVNPYAVGVFGPGFYAPALAAPYPVTVNRVNIVVQPPPTVIVNLTNRGAVSPEIAGIDLDEIDPHTLKARKPAAEREPIPERPVRPAPEKKPEEAIRPRPAPPAPPQALPPAEEEHPDPNASLTDLGKRAFAERKYGLAAERFRQAALADPMDPMPHFLLAQTRFALGKYADAVKAIHAGLELKKDWPAARFPPRELYRGNDLDFLGHQKRLEDVLDRHPDDPVLLFLLAYELWFDGKRDKARPLLEKARKLAPDPADIDRFLQALGVGPVAAR